MKKQKAISLKPHIILESVRGAFFMLKPLTQAKNPVIFIAYVGAIFVTIYAIVEFFNDQPFSFDLHIAVWLWFTVLFANFAEAIAESRGKAHALFLRKTQVESLARQIKNGIEVKVQSTLLQKGDIVICETGEIIPADGEVIEGVATVDESAITGESAPVIRESGGDRSAVTAGTKVVSDRLIIKVTAEIGDGFLDRMIHLIEGAKRQKTPNEIALITLLCSLTFVFILTVASFKFYMVYSEEAANTSSFYVTVPVLIALLVSLIPTTIGGLLSAVGIAGMDRLIRRNIIARSGRSVEAAGDIDLLILDKTGTITMGNRMASAFLPAAGYGEKECARISQLASLSDETPEGRSIVVLAKQLFGLRGEANVSEIKFIPFSASSKISGVDFIDAKGVVSRSIRKGAIDAIRKHVESLGGLYPNQLDAAIHSIANKGATPLLVSDDKNVIGVIVLKDVIKGGLKEKFTEMRNMGIRTLMITGDNPLTAAAIAAEAGIDDYIAEATPEMKLDIIKREQIGGRLVAMAGDGTNDAPALAQADVGVAMNTGTQASRDAGNMIDLDSNPTKVIDIVEIGKQLLMTRGALTTFSIANDIAKYFAILPAILGGLYISQDASTGPLEALNVMSLHSPKSAILSAVIFNSLIIVALIPLALKGVSYKAQSAYELLRNNIFVYGIGGIFVPFIGIKCIDIIITFFGVI